MRTNLQGQTAAQCLLKHGEDGKRHEETFGSKGMFTILIVLMVSWVYPMSKLINCIT